ncbi:MAG TPA: CapA family protein [Tenuifilaceae bacterium]|nr:CapA family protein [Tenuifilaceae bacterium]
MQKLITLTICFFSISFSFSQDSTKVLKLMFVGDVMGHSPQINSAYDSATKTFNYDSVFSRVKSVFSLADYVVANLEVTLAGEPYKGYPQFSSPDELVDGLVNSGVNVIVNANNHSVDRGGSGIKRTIEVLNAKGIPHTGTFLDSIDRVTHNPLIVEKYGIKLALLNYTYGTNGLVVPAPYIVNYIDTLKMGQDINTAKSLGVDDIVVFIHWGNEYERTPSTAQRWLAGWLHGKGVRIVIGSHPHVIQRMEATFDTDSTNGNVTVYSLGNFVSNQRKRYCDGGVLAYLELAKPDSGQSKIVNAGYIPVWVRTPYKNGRKKYQVLPVSEYENAARFNAAEDSSFTTFTTDTRTLLNSQNVNFPEIKFIDGNWIIPAANR